MAFHQRQLLHKDREYLIEFTNKKAIESWTLIDYINDANGVPIAVCLEGNWIPWHRIAAFRLREESDAVDV